MIEISSTETTTKKYCYNDCTTCTKDDCDESCDTGDASDEKCEGCWRLICPHREYYSGD